jgi:translation initiation factor IF-3
VRPRRFKGRFVKPEDDHRVNHRIRVPEVRLIDDEGNQLGVVSTQEAIKMAVTKGLDLLEVAPNAKPPVCRIIDYGKFKYEKKKKEHKAKKKQVVVKVKEVQIRPTTDEHDRDVKIKNLRSFLEDGDKVKITMLFRGRQITHTDQGYLMMKVIREAVKEVGVPESPPRMDGRKLIMILTPLQKKTAKESTPKATHKPGKEAVSEQPEKAGASERPEGPESTKSTESTAS